MWNEVFPGTNINTNLVDSKDFIVVIANLFKNESLSGLERKLVQEYRIEHETATKVVFLVSLLSFKVEDVLDFFRKKVSSGISDSTILEWLSNGNETPMLINFIHYKPTVSSQDLMEQGFKGNKLGIEIKRLEVEKFKQML